MEENLANRSRGELETALRDSSRTLQAMLATQLHDFDGECRSHPYSPVGSQRVRFREPGHPPGVHCSSQPQCSDGEGTSLGLLGTPLSWALQGASLLRSRASQPPGAESAVCSGGWGVLGVLYRPLHGGELSLCPVGPTQGFVERCSSLR